MTELTVLPTHPDLASFGSESRPLRPSRVSKFLRCAMSVVLVMHEEDGGAKPAAETGNLVHDAAEHYHKTKGTEEERVAAGLRALEAARVQFPAGDAEKARQIFRAYVADETNRSAEVVWCEEQVRLTLEAAPQDPTGRPIVIVGTLDQVRRDRVTGVLSVWDIKTGGYLTGEDSVLDYLIQQAVYTLAARQTLDPAIEPGGLIYTPGYERPRRGATDWKAVHLPNPLTAAQCADLLLTLPDKVARIRAGDPIFEPSAAACKFCDVKRNLASPWPKCRTRFRGVYGR